MHKIDSNAYRFFCLSDSSVVYIEYGATRRIATFIDFFSEFFKSVCAQTYRRGDNASCKRKNGRDRADRFYEYFSIFYVLTLGLFARQSAA